MYRVTSRTTGRPIGARYPQGLRIYLFEGSPGDAFDRGASPTCLRTIRVEVADAQCKVCGCAWQTWKLQGRYQRERVVNISRQGMCNLCGVGQSPFIITWVKVSANSFIDQTRKYAQRHPTERGSFRLLCSSLKSSEAIRILRDYIARAREIASSIRYRDVTYHGTLSSAIVDENKFDYAESGLEADQTAQFMDVEQGTESGEIDSASADNEVHKYLCMSDDHEQ